MLKIILNSLECDKYLNGQRLVESINSHFNRMKQQEWFKDPFVNEIIQKIDNAHVELGFSVVNDRTGAGYSVDSLSGGSKYLILTHCLRDRIYLSTMGDNCCDFLERIALDYEREGKDLTIVSNYVNKFKFNYVKEIEYVNYNYIAHSTDEICNDIFLRFCDDTEKYRKGSI